MRGRGCRHIHGVLPFKSVASDTPAATMAVGWDGRPTIMPYQDPKVGMAKERANTNIK